MEWARSHTLLDIPLYKRDTSRIPRLMLKLMRHSAWQTLANMAMCVTS